MGLMHDRIELIVVCFAVLGQNEDLGELTEVSCAISGVCGAGAVEKGGGLVWRFHHLEKGC